MIAPAGLEHSWGQWAESHELTEETEGEYSAIGVFWIADLYVIHPDLHERWIAVALYESFSGDHENPPETEDHDIGQFDTLIEAQTAAEKWAVELQDASRLADEEIEQAMMIASEGEPGYA